MDINTGKITDANKAAEKFYGWTRKELTDMKITDIALADEEEHKKFRIDVYRRGAENPMVRIISHKLKNDEVKRVELTIAPIEV